MRKCRNWQTSKTKDLVVVTPCGFKSHLPQYEKKVVFHITFFFIFVSAFAPLIAQKCLPLHAAGIFL